MNPEELKQLNECCNIMKNGIQKAVEKGGVFTWDETYILKVASTCIENSLKKLNEQKVEQKVENKVEV